MINFTKFFKTSFLFIGFAILGYILFVLIWGDFKSDYLKSNLSYQKLASGHLTSRLKEVDTVRDVDILFLGSSRSYRHYDTRIFKNEGYKVFNLGSSSQTLLQTEYLVNKYYSQLNPKIVVLDLWPDMFSGDGVESTLDIISNDKNNWESVKLAFQHKNIKVLNTLIYAYYREIIHSSNDILEKKYKKETSDLYIEGGFVERKVYFAEIEEFTDIKILLNEYQLKAFNNILEKIKSPETKIFVVCSPMHKSKFDSYKNFYIIDSLLNNHNLSLEKFIDLKELNEIKHFYNSYHLNQDGVEIFNKYFIKNILK